MKYIEYRETRRHGTLDFPLEFYHVTPSHPRYEMSYHWHVECELMRITKGEFLMTLNNEEFNAKAGDIFFINSGTLHGGIPDRCVYECIVFDMETLARANNACQRLIKKISSSSIDIYTQFSDKDEALHHIIWNLFGTMRSRTEGHELTVIGALYQFFGYILENHCYTKAQDVPEKNVKRMEQLKSVLELIEEHYNEYLSLKDLARCAGMSSKYFCRFFHEMTHRTPIDYLNYYRIEQACFKLATSDASITEIALGCGFNDISYFTKTFKKYKGITPKKYLSAPL